MTKQLFVFFSRLLPKKMWDLYVHMIPSLSYKGNTPQDFILFVFPFQHQIIYYLAIVQITAAQDENNLKLIPLFMVRAACNNTGFIKICEMNHVCHGPRSFRWSSLQNYYNVGCWWLIDRLKVCDCLIVILEAVNSILVIYKSWIENELFESCQETWKVWKTLSEHLVTINLQWAFAFL